MNHNKHHDTPSATPYIIEDGTVAGNIEHKYVTTNPIHRWLMRGFLRQAEAYVRQTNCLDVYEAGCGEGFLSIELSNRIPGLQVRGSDFSEQVIEIAKDNAAEANKPFEFTVTDIYHLTPEKHAADLVLCCEVMEHLERPEEALQTLSRIARKHLLLSVPNEPLWRILNMSRGKYIRSFGNTPGHLNHWTPRAFRQFLERELIVEFLSCPLPWTMALCRPRRPVQPTEQQSL